MKFLEQSKVTYWLQYTRTYCFQIGVLSLILCINMAFIKL